MNGRHDSTAIVLDQARIDRGGSTIVPDLTLSVPVGTVFVGVALPDAEPEAVQLRLPGDRRRIREFSAISALDLLRRRLQELGG